VTVGETLTEARYQAGLSVDELSERTRIRETVIRSIERDDYEACGGDLYVRGYVRAIAGAVGIDARPLIREYDQSRGTSEPRAPEPDATALDLPPVPAREADATRPEPDATRLDLPPVPVGDPAETRYDLPPVTDDAGAASRDQILSADPAATRYDLPPVKEPLADPPPLLPSSAPTDLMAAGYDLPPAPPRSASPWPDGVTGGMQGPPRQAAGPRHGGGGRNRHVPAIAAVVATALVLAAVAILVVRLTSSGTPTGRLAAASSPRASSSPKASSVAKAAKAKPATKPATKPAVNPAPVLPPVTRLPIAAVEAFGPGGLADGDNPQAASFAIARNAPQPWSTQWYATAEFGMDKKGTGLLVDLGHQVTITSVYLGFSAYRGLNLQLKTGDGTAPGDFKVVATQTDTGGALRLTLHQPATARYLLIWFTLLPPNGEGQYQESVSSVLVNGRA